MSLGVPARAESKVAPPLPSCLIWPQWITGCLPALVRMTFIQSIGSNASLF